MNNSPLRWEDRPIEMVMESGLRTRPAICSIAISLALLAPFANALAQGALAQEKYAASPSPKGLTVAPVLKTSTTVLGQEVQYPVTDKPEVVSVVQTYAAGGETGWHYHLVSSHIYVLEGALSLEMADGEKREFIAGQAYMESVKTWHNARNLGAVPLKLLVVSFGERLTSNNIFGKKDN